MPAFTTITVNDREDTPVAHTFDPRNEANGVYFLKESDGTPIGDNVISVSTRQSGNKYKSRVRLTMPVVVDETINGVVVPKVIRTAYADLNFTFADTSTSQERKNVLGIISNLLRGTANVSLMDGILVDLNGAY